MLTKIQCIYLLGLCRGLKQLEPVKGVCKKLDEHIKGVTPYFPDAEELQFFNELILPKMEYFAGKDESWFSFCSELHENISDMLYRINELKKEQ